jgi:hypothetical protein
LFQLSESPTVISILLFTGVVAPAVALAIGMTAYARQLFDVGWAEEERGGGVLSYLLIIPTDFANDADQLYGPDVHLLSKGGGLGAG